MKKVEIKVILLLISILSKKECFCQIISIRDSISYEVKKNSAINSANIFLDKWINNKEISNCFIVDSKSSLVVCEDYKTFFNLRSVFCEPNGFEILFNVILKKENSYDTLNSNLFISIDSNFEISKSSLQKDYLKYLIQAWKKVKKNNYKVNYDDVIKLGQQKNFSNYFIQFYSDKKNPRKFYWYLTCNSFLYKINPNTGKLFIKKLHKQRVISSHN